MQVNAENFRNLLTEKGNLVDAEIARIIPIDGKVSGLSDIAWYTLSSGGKRIRPAMCLLATEALGGNTRFALRFAASMELLHTFLLIHDDIEDGDTVRRGQPSAWVKYGLAHGVNSGDYILVKVYDAINSLAKTGMSERKVTWLLDKVNFALNETAEGQAIEINSRSRNDLTEGNYMEIVQKKTGAYLTLPIIGAALISDCSDITIACVQNYGSFVGPAFQIRDDIIDLTEGKGRGEIGCDIKEGKRSFLVTCASSVCSEEERDVLYSVLNKPRGRKTEDDISSVIRLFDKYNVVDSAEGKVAELVRFGKDAIKTLPDNLRQLLCVFADFAIKRDT